MFRLSRRMLLYILFAVFALTISPSPLLLNAQTSSLPACAVTPNALGGQGFSFAGQGFSFAGQGFSFAGQGFSFAGQGFSFAGQGIDPVEVAQEILDNQITPDWFVNLLPGLTTGLGYGSQTSALVIIDDQNHGADVLAALNALTTDPRVAPYMANIEIHFIDIGTPTINYEANGIRAAIEAKVNELQLRGIEHTVLNMSFGFLPCEDPATGFNFNDYIEERAKRENPQSVYPELECVYEIDEGLYVARFGYFNENDEPVTIVVGDNNQLDPSHENGRLPLLFEPGWQQGVFEIPFDGGDLVWTLEGPDGIQHTSSTSVEAPGCDVAGSYYYEYLQEICELGPIGTEEPGAEDDDDEPCNQIAEFFPEDVTPTLVCVAFDEETDLFTARFGYINANSTATGIPISFANAFSGEGFNRGQPEYFLPGIHDEVFEVPFSSSLTWTIISPNGNSHSVSASGESEGCIDDPGFSVGDYLSENLGLSDDAVLSTLTRFVNNVESETDLAPLRALLRQYLNDSLSNGNTRTVFTVASSGNYFPWLGATPLVPARWYETISSSAGLGNNGPLWRFSQYGNILIPGAGYNVGNKRIISGTSFSAPGLSLALAQYGTYPSACSVNEFGGIIYPPVVNTNFTNTPLTVDENNPLICSINLAPTAVDDAYTVVQGELLTVNPIGILVNDSDPDGDPLTAGLNSPALYGNVLVNADGSFSYQHDGSENFIDSFTYIISDAGNPEGTDTATVFITIDPAPDGTEEPEPGGVVSISLYDADSNQVVTEFDPIPNGGTIVEIVIGTNNDDLTLVANTSGEIGSVVFDVNTHDNFRTENVTPYALAGDGSGNFNAWDFDLDVDYLVRATAYTESNGTGDAINSVEVLVRFVNEVIATEEPTEPTPTEETPTEPTPTEPTPTEETPTEPTPDSNMLVVSFTLINADTNQPVPGFDPIPANSEIDISVQGTQFNVRANTEGTIGSVVFDRFDGVTLHEGIRTENGAPYAFAGDNSGNYNPMNFQLDVIYTIYATPYSESNADGDAGNTASISISFIDSSIVATEEAVASPEATDPPQEEAVMQPEVTPSADE